MTKLQKLSAAVAQEGLDALLITGMSNLTYATGNTHLEGAVIVSADGRGWCLASSIYIETAEKTAGPEGYSVFMPEKTFHEETARLCKENNFKKLGFEDAIMTVAVYDRYKEALEGVELAPGSALVSKLRAVKEDWEVDCIEAAQRIAEKALEKLLPEMKPGRTEQELAGLLDFYAAGFGSEGPSFKTILLSGPNSSLPHGRPGGRVLQAGDFVKIDFGATKNGYHSDMTRTFVIGHASDEMKKIYDTVLRAKLVGIEAFDVGKIGSEVHMAAAKVIEDAGYGKYFGHGLGHGVGLNIHEAPSAGKLSENVFEVGHIVTIEPGIYIPGLGGVRIEDMVYLGKNGKRNVTLFPSEMQIL